MFQFKPLQVSDITPRALILSMMNSIGTDAQTISELVHAAVVFDIEPSSVRVAASRLVKEGILNSPERGVYALSEQARHLTRRVQTWQNAASRMVPWQGDWMVGLTHHLGRTDRKQLRSRERAFSLFGYQEAETGVWVRPANLSLSFVGHREDLIRLGADEDIMSFLVSEAALPASQNWRSLWSAEALSANYRAAITAMTDSLARLNQLPPVEGARESLLIGQSVIRAINLDPLLPEDLSNQTLFLQMVDLMKTYNIAGRAAWRAYREQR